MSFIIKKNNFSDLKDLKNLDEELVLKIKKESSLFQIDKENWKGFGKIDSYPQVDSYLSFNQDNLFLYFESINKEFLARYNNNNDNVYKDTCLEFFISFDKIKYYNFETNANKACLSAFGKKSQRTRREEEVFKKIKRFSKLERKDDLIYWNLFIVINKDVFSFDDIEGFDNKNIYFNIYSCFDDAKTPYFLSAFPIEKSSPSFHEIDFFQKGVLNKDE